MGHELDFELPVRDSACETDDGSDCGLKAYVSNEEAAILASMRKLKQEADRLRTRRSKAGSEQERQSAVDRLAELRDLWADLAGQRELAFKRKMIMLGHLPPDDEIELF